MRSNCHLKVSDGFTRDQSFDIPIKIVSNTEIKKKTKFDIGQCEDLFLPLR